MLLGPDTDGPAEVAAGTGGTGELDQSQLEVRNQELLFASYLRS